MSSDWDTHDTGEELSQEMIEDLKAEYGPLFKTPIEGVPYYFRTLTRRDAVELGLMDGFLDPDTEEAVFLRCMLHPLDVNFDILPAGAPTTVAQEILSRSGLSGSKWPNEYIDRARSKMSVYHTIAATICAGFTNLLPGTLDDLNIEQLMNLLVEAEEVLSIRARVARGDYVALEFEDQDDSKTSGSTEMSQQDKDAMLRAMLEGSMEDTPSGWIDRSKVPNGGNILPDDSRDI